MPKTGVLAAFIALGIESAAYAAVPLQEKDQWKISIGGFVETDAISDSTRGLSEVVGNNPVARPETAAGSNSQAMLSIRNSRLAFTVEAPEAEGMKAKGYYEFDLLGYDPAPGASNTEGAYFNNPTFRVRHAYLSAESGSWQLLAGQTWNLFGWQPYYFTPTVQVSPVAGQLYGRTAQLRALNTRHLSDSTDFQLALGVMRPPQRDSGLPGLEGGVRLAFGSRSSGFTGGSTGAQKPQPMSIGISGAAREFAIPRVGGLPNETVHFPGGAVAADVLLPVIASSDGKDVSNTLTLTGEYSAGTGYGDEFSGWSGNLASPLSTATNGTAATTSTNLDAGIGDFDASGAFHLAKLRTFNANFQYHLPAQTRTWFSGGYGQLFSDNIGDLVGPNGQTSAKKIPYDREQVVFANVFHDLSHQVRVGFEVAQTQTRYVDGEHAHDNRYQLSAWFLF